LPEPNIQAERVDAVPPDDGTFSGAGILEGPVWSDGSLYVSEWNAERSQILKVVPGASVSVHVADAGANGLALNAQGDLLGACFVDGTICRFPSAAPNERNVVAGMYDGMPFTGVNDLAIRSDGTIYFSDLAAGRVYRIGLGGEISIVDEALNQPNGVTLSADETTLYVAEYIATTERWVYRYGVLGDGAITGKAPFALGGGDGMAADCAGNLYVARGREVVVLDSSAVVLGTIQADVAEGTTNVAFGGSERTTLYITSWGAPHGLHAALLGVPGMPY
jgi:gluconolactonase